MTCESFAGWPRQRGRHFCVCAPAARPLPGRHKRAGGAGAPAARSARHGTRPGLTRSRTRRTKTHLALVGAQAAQALLQLQQHVLHRLALHVGIHVLDEHALGDVGVAPGAALAGHGCCCGGLRGLLLLRCAFARAGERRGCRPGAGAGGWLRRWRVLMGPWRCWRTIGVRTGRWRAGRTRARFAMIWGREAGCGTAVPVGE